MPVSMKTQLTLPKLPTRERGGVPRSQRERMWLISGGLIAFVMLLIGFFFFIRPARSDTADVRSQVSAAKQQNAALQARITSLREQNKNLPKYLADLAQAQLALPPTSGIPDFLRSLQSLGNATQTTVTALSVSDPTDVTVQAATQSSPAAGQPAAQPTTAAASPAAGASTGAAAAAAGSGIYALPINATVSGTPVGLARFLDQLQAAQPRAVLITKITLGGTSCSCTGHATSVMSLQLTMDAFVAPSNSSENASLSAAAASH